MRRPAAITALCAVLVAVMAPAAAHAQDGQIRLVLRPADQPGSYFDLTMLPGEARTLEVDIGNDGDAPLLARTYAADVYTIINGGFGARLRDEPQTGTTGWLDYPTELLPLAVRGGLRRTFAVSVPADAGPGEYITSLVLENEEPFQQTGAVALSQIVRQAIAVVITVPGERSPLLRVGAASHKDVVGVSVVDVAVENTGNVRLKPSVTFTLVDGSGNIVGGSTVVMDTFYADTATFVEVPLAMPLPAGAYTVRLHLEDRADGLPEMEAVIPLVVGPRAETAASARPDPIGDTRGSDQRGIFIGSVIALAALVLIVVCVSIMRRRRHPAADPA
jgi:hypothetical protein